MQIKKKLEKLLQCDDYEGIYGLKAQEQALKVDVVGALIEILQDDFDLKSRCRAAYALGKIKDVKAIAPLIQCLGYESGEDENPLKDKAYYALEGFGEPIILPLAHILENEDEDQKIRMYAASLLAHLARNYKFDSYIIDVLINALEDEDYFVVDYACHALSRIKESRAVEPLIRILRKKEYQIKAAEALGEIGDKRAVKPLLPLLKDEDKKVRLLTLMALGKLGDSTAIKEMVPLLQDEDFVNRYWTAQILANFGENEEVTQALITALESQPSISNQRISFDEVRISLAKALGKIGDSRAISVLTRLSQDE